MQCAQCGSQAQDGARYCPVCGTPLASSTVDDLPNQSAQSRSVTRRVAMVLFPVALVAGVAVFLRYLNPAVHSVIKQQPVVASTADYDSSTVLMKEIGFRDESGDLVFSLDDVKRYRLVRFQYTGGTTPRPVMAYIAPTGQLVTAISLSEHCGSTEFTIKDNKIYCARCPSSWDMMTMEAYACCAKYYPDPIPSRVVGDEVHVPKAFVEKWAGRM